jgi:hypothetical protein
MRLHLTVLLVCVTPTLLYAQAEPPADPKATTLLTEDPLGVASISAIWENDGRFFEVFADSDRWYTNGLEVDMSFTRPWPGAAARLLPFKDNYDDPRKAGGIVFGQQIFTPEDIESPALIPDDRPYAGYLYAGLYVQQADDIRMDHLELNVGVVGSWSQAEDAQRFVHSILPNQVEPRGWDHQLANELAINVTYEHRWKTPRAQLADLELDLIGGVGFRAGNVHTDMNASVTGRIGYNLPNDFGPANIDSFRDATGTWAEDFGVYAYGRAMGRAVAHDILLDGNTFANSHSIGHKELVGTIEVGVMLHYKWFETGWTTTWQSEQFDGQAEPHVIGAWTIAGRFTY